MEEWYLIYTKPHKEPIVNRQLEDRGVEVFFPTLQFDRGYNRGIRLEPFFPHYLFARLDLRSAGVGDLRWLMGVRTVVHFDARPAIVPDAVIEMLQERLQPYGAKVMRRSEWLFKPGQRVTIVNGPFAGFEALFQKGLNGTDRVQILLNMLGTWTRAEISSQDLKAA
ncbi:MAG: transcription termination/antitermination NusG family protein [Caldilineaceae bacterium]